MIAVGCFVVLAGAARAESLNKLEHDQYGNSASPDVDASASRGADKSVVKQERDQIGNSAQPDVDPNASKGPDESITDQERSQIPH
jgi:hypothetical protein